MKKIITLAAFILSLTMGAQTMKIHCGNTTYAIPSAKAGAMTYENGKSIIIMGKTYDINKIDSITVDKSVYKDSTILINYATSNAKVIIPGAISTLVSDTINGANVSIGSSQLEGGEIKYELSGNSANGSFTQWGSYKCTIRLNGIVLNNTNGAAINIYNGKRINVELNEGTTNTLTDSKSGNQEACFYVKGHPEFSGTGTLNLIGNATHAFKSKEYTLLKASTGKINITSAAGDGIHVGQYFEMNGGNITINGTKGDGIDVGITKDNTDEFNGQIIINNGSIKINVTADDVKAIKADSIITINGGTLNLTNSGDGSKSISTDIDLIINEIDATKPTIINVNASGGKYTDSVTGDTSKCYGIKVDRNLLVNGGTTTVINTGKAYGCKVGNYQKTGGTFIANFK